MSRPYNCPVCRKILQREPDPWFFSCKTCLGIWCLVSMSDDEFGRDRNYNPTMEQRKEMYLRMRSEMNKHVNNEVA